MEHCVQTSKCINSSEAPKLAELAEACVEERASEMQQLETPASVELTEAALASGTEVECGRTKAKKPSKTKRKSSTPRKVVLPRDKEAPLESPPKQRKSQRIRTPARAIETSPVRKSSKKRSTQDAANHRAGSRTKGISAVKNKRAPIKKSNMGQRKTAKKKARSSPVGNRNEEIQESLVEETRKINQDQDEEEEAGEKCLSQSSGDEKDSSSEKGSQPASKKKIIHKKRPCEVCGRCYNTFYLKVHMRKHTGEKPFACKECTRSFSTDSLLRTHAQRYHGNTDELHCDVCRKVFASKGSLKIHRQIHSEEKPYKCHLCDKEFKQPGVLNEHLKTHTNDYPFICEVCGKRFKSKRSVFRHKESAHDGVKNLYLCTACGKIFHDKSSLWRHQKRHEQGYTKHVCEVCGKQFHERKVLSTHMLIHENKKPYQCEVCKKQFRHYSVLKRHMCCHTGVKPFKCDKCSRQFIHRVYMLRHKCTQKDVEKNGAEDPQPKPFAAYGDGQAVFVEQILLDADVASKDVVVFVPDLVASNVSLPPLHETPGQDPAQEIPQDSEPLQMFLPLQPQPDIHVQAETVVVYENVDGIDIWTN